MDKNNLKLLCIIERITIIAITIGISLLNISGDARSLIIILGIILLVIVPEQTKRKFSETSKSRDIKIENELIVKSNDIQTENELSIKGEEQNIVEIEKLFKKTGKDIGEENIKKDIQEENIELDSTYDNYELPNLDLLTEDIEIREVVQSKEFAESKSNIIVGLKDDLNTKIINIQKTSHMLIAGTTGIGKTMLLDNIVINILYKSKPDELKFVMFDTSNNSLRIYNGIPHLLIPVITDAQKAVVGLDWIAYEIEYRLRLFIEANTENIIDYNNKQKLTNKSKIPTIIVVIDEISDIVNCNKEIVEDYFVKITKYGKKAGVFLIISTNRPSTDIVSGLIKANIYTRISFFLPSKLDSRLILDVEGAEKLKNHGDILFKTLGIIKPIKYHCPYISTNGIKNVVNSLKKYENKYSMNIIEKTEKINCLEEEIVDEDDEIDPFLIEAIDAVVELGQASASFMQRRFKIGYARAGRIIDQMEARGIISGYEGSKPRQVLLSKERWEELKKSNNV